MSDQTPTSPSPANAGPRGGRLVAWILFVFGSLASVAGNILAARVPPVDAGPTWTPRLDTQLGSVVWPVGLLLSVEVLARIRWPSGVWWRLARYGGVGAVAVFSAVISYGHIHLVLSAWGYEWQGTIVGPLAVDGMMVVAGAALLADHHRATGATPVTSPVTSDDELLKAQAKIVLHYEPKIGRYKLRDALLEACPGRKITENQARQLLDDLRSEAEQPQLQAVNDGN